jgi:hypothetical protein
MMISEFPKSLPVLFLIHKIQNGIKFSYQHINPYPFEASASLHPSFKKRKI